MNNYQNVIIFSSITMMSIGFASFFAYLRCIKHQTTKNKVIYTLFLQICLLMAGILLPLGFLMFISAFVSNAHVMLITNISKVLSCVVFVIFAVTTFTKMIKILKE